MSENTCVVVILTFNSANIIKETLGQALKVTPNVFVVDSASKDGTDEIARSMGCEVAQHQFSNYGQQRNWAISQVRERYTWQLHLDADEVLDAAAIASILAVLEGKSDYDAYMLKRRDYFMGRELRFSGVNPWHLRLFKSSVGQCENRMYDQHFIADCPVGKLKGLMHDKNSLAIADWTARHNRWSDLEADQVALQEYGGDGVLKARLFGDGRERARFYRKFYYTVLPVSLRALPYFIYRYFFRLGIADGMPGFYFAFFQALWFHLLIDAKIYERQHRPKSPGTLA
jgi:glycosyltransferase involved in cell wall biosynthesis